MKKLLFASACTVIAIVSCTPSKQFLVKKSVQENHGRDYVRVLINTFDDEIRISSKTRMRVTEIATRRIKYESNGSAVTIPIHSVKEPLLVESWNSPISVNGVSYRGSIELHNVIGKVYAINVVLMEDYLSSVVPAEIPSSWNIQALKAQAVAARTYAYYHLRNKTNTLYDLDSTTKFQVYRGVSAETSATTDAVSQTSGEILSFNGEAIQAIFHSTCGGKTVSDKFIWGGEGHPYLEGVKCQYCRVSPEFSWKAELSLNEIRSALLKKYKSVGEIKSITFQKKDDRVVDVNIVHGFGKISMQGNEFRLLFPSKKLRSMYFSSRKTRNGLILTGNGWGHGVGLCQWGAKGMAESGAHYTSILKYYYNNKIRIVKLDSRRGRDIASSR